MIDLSNISLQFNGKYLFKDVNYKISSGDRISLVGDNGTGKTSLLRLITGKLEPETGKVLKQKRISIGYLPQENVLHSGKTLIDECLSALEDIKLMKEKEKTISEELNNEKITDEERYDLINQLGEVHHRLEELDSFSAEAKVQKILMGLGFDEKDFERLTDEFSGGWQMRIALAKILIQQNDVLLLDEPTNHLDLDSLEWLIDFLKNYQGALLIVSHDKNFINQVTNKTLEIFLGKFYTFKGDYESYQKYKAERDEQAIQKFEQQQKQIKQTQQFIERFRYKATKARQVQSRIKQLEKIDLIVLPESREKINIKFPEPPQSGRIPVKLENIYKSYGNNSVFSGVNFEINKGEKIAFVGPNGAGKSTLAKIIAGVLDINSGNRIIGHNTMVSYYAQDVADQLDPELDIIDSVYGIAEDKTIGQLRSLLGSFLFSDDDVFKKVSVLSGGEKSRVALCKILLTKANLIILDEPTNHLDYTSKLILQNALINFTGSLVIVSHDVDFLKPIVNKVVDIRKGNLKIFPGDMEYYLSKRKEINLSFHEEKSLNIQRKDSLSKKDQKRIEAELRQKKHKATKDLKKKITSLEERISGLEKEEKGLELKLSQQETYLDSNLAKQVTNRFEEVKEELANTLKLWEELNTELLSIETTYS